MIQIVQQTAEPQTSHGSVPLERQAALYRDVMETSGATWAPAACSSATRARAEGTRTRALNALEGTQRPAGSPSRARRRLRRSATGARVRLWFEVRGLRRRPDTRNRGTMRRITPGRVPGWHSALRQDIGCHAGSDLTDSNRDVSSAGITPKARQRRRRTKADRGDTLRHQSEAERLAAAANAASRKTLVLTGELHSRGEGIPRSSALTRWQGPL